MTCELIVSVLWQTCAQQKTVSQSPGAKYSMSVW